MLNVLSITITKQLLLPILAERSNFIYQTILRLRFLAHFFLLNRSMSTEFALTLALSPRRGDKSSGSLLLREKGWRGLAPLREEGISYLHSAMNGIFSLGFRFIQMLAYRIPVLKAIALNWG